MADDAGRTLDLFTAFLTSFLTPHNPADRHHGCYPAALRVDSVMKQCKGSDGYLSPPSRPHRRGNDIPTDCPVHRNCVPSSSSRLHAYLNQDRSLVMNGESPFAIQLENPPLKVPYASTIPSCPTSRTHPYPPTLLFRPRQTSHGSLVHAAVVPSHLSSCIRRHPRYRSGEVVRQCMWRESTKQSRRSCIVNEHDIRDGISKGNLCASAFRVSVERQEAEILPCKTR